MRLEWLEDILAIADTGSFSRATQPRHVTQSAVSRRIQQIEQHIGIELFDRSQKPAQLRATTLTQSKQISATMRQLVSIHGPREGRPLEKRRSVHFATFTIWNFWPWHDLGYLKRLRWRRARIRQPRKGVGMNLTKPAIAHRYCALGEVLGRVPRIGG